MYSKENTTDQRESTKRLNDLKNLYEVSKYLFELGFMFDKMGRWIKNERTYYEQTSVFIVEKMPKVFKLSSKNGSITFEDLIQFENLVEEINSFKEVRWEIKNNYMNPLDVFHYEGQFFFNLSYIGVYDDYKKFFVHKKPITSFNFNLVFIDKDNKNILHVKDLVCYINGNKYETESFPEEYEPNTNLILLPDAFGKIEGLR